MSSTVTKNNQNNWKDFVAGAVAGIAARTVTSPIDVLKIRLQVQESKGNPSIKNVTRDLLKNEGIKAFWKGNSAGIALYASYNAIQFSVYDFLSKSEDDYFGPFVNGGIAALTATSLTYPFDLIRTRMSIAKNGNNIINEIRRITRVEGAKGLFKGYFLTIGQVVPYMGCIFATHKLFSNHFSDFWSGAAAGFVCKTIFMPSDVFRRRLQLFQTHPDQFCLKQLAYTQRSSDRIDLLKKMWLNEGPKAFFRGWSMAVIKSTPVTAVTFSVHKLVKDFL